MKICFFGTYFYNYSRTNVLRTGFKQLGVHIVEVHKSPSYNRLESFSDFSVNNIINSIFDKLSISVLLLGQYKKVFSSDVVVVLYPGYIILPIAWLLCIIGRKKLVFDAFTSMYDSIILNRKLAPKNSIKAKILKNIEKTLMSLPHKLFVDTELMKKFIHSEFKISKNKLFVIPVGADNGVYIPLKKKVIKEKIEIVWFGAYSPLHGADYIIGAAKLLQKNKLIHFTMIGDGVIKKEMVDFAKKSQLKNVEFINKVSEDILVTYIQKADIILGIFSQNPMAKRVIPNKVFAGLACRKPVITADSMVYKNTFIHKKHIIFCKPENSYDLARSITLLSKDKKLRETIADDGHALYISKFTPKTIAQNFLNNVTSFI